MFKLELYDRKGIKLKLGDVVKISNGKHFNVLQTCEGMNLEIKIINLKTK